MCEELFRLCYLHYPALVDYHYSVRNEPYYGKVVSYEQIGEAPFVLELLEQVEDLGSYGYVQSGDRLVRDDEFRIHYYGPCDTNALALSAGELVRVPCEMLRQEAYGLYYVHDLLHPVLLVLVEVEVVQAFGDDVFDRSTLVERSCRVLEDHLDLPYHLAVLGLGDLAGDALAVVNDLACGAGVDPDYRAAYGGLSGAGLAYQGKSLALVDVEADVFDSLEALLAVLEDYVKIPYGKQHFFLFI